MNTDWMATLTANAHREDLRGVYRLDDGQVVATDGVAFVVAKDPARIAAPLACAAAIQRHLAFEVERNSVLPFARLTQWLGELGKDEVVPGRVFGELVNRKTVKRFLGPLTAESVHVLWHGYRTPIAIADTLGSWRICVAPLRERMPEFSPIYPELVQ